MSAISATPYDIVIPTIGRPSLSRLLASLAADLPAGGDHRPASVVVVDDRSQPDGPLELAAAEALPVATVRSGGRGPAAARNRGWRHSSSPWICFLDDDVEVRPGWSRRLADDLSDAHASVAAVQGRVHVPMPVDRRPTDRERKVGGLATATWITADMAVRRIALADVGGFDERFPRAYREDADLCLRLVDAGWRIGHGRRHVRHPVGDARWTVSITSQRGNADDRLMRRLHGRGWRQRADAPRGALRSHLATTATAVAAVGAAACNRPRAAAALGAGWLVQWGRFTVVRTAPGPRAPGEVAAMAATSALLPSVAAYWAARGEVRARREAPAGGRDQWGSRRPRAVLFDRDGTLVGDVPYNADPDLVEPVPGVAAALDRLRRVGVAVGLISNQSGVARGLLTRDQVAAVNARVVDLLGPFDTVQWCPHGPGDGCRCRKPAAGMIEVAARELGVSTMACAVVGDIGSDIEAGLAAGARAVMVPTAVTRDEEIVAAPEVAGSVADAVDALLSGVRLDAGHRLAAGTDLQSCSSGERAS